jgi:rifampin ADP-ribosylating transferase
VGGAELAVARTGRNGRGHVSVVEPTGPFEDDPNVTNKRFPGNVTQSYRTRDPVRVVEEVHDWENHPRDVVQQLLRQPRPPA